VRLSGAHGKDPHLRELVAPSGEATYPFTHLISRAAAHLTARGDPGAAPGLPSFADGVAALRIAEQVQDPHGARPDEAHT